MNGQGIVGVCAGDERRGVVSKGRRAPRRGGAQVREFLDFAKELVKDGSLEQPAKVLPLNPVVVDAQFAVQGLFKRLKPKPDGKITGRVVEASAGGAIRSPPLVGGSGASELRCENRGTAGGGGGLGGQGGCLPVHTKLGVCCAAELRVAVCDRRPGPSANWGVLRMEILSTISVIITVVGKCLIT